MVNPIEMASPQEHVSEQLTAIPGYAAAFRAAFPGELAPVTLAKAQKAIAVFEATLITPNAPFDKYLQGDESALSATQKQGLQLFMDKGCSVCHNGINLGGGMYAPFGVVENPGAELLPPNDKGRFTVTKSVSDQDRIQSADVAEHRVDRAVLSYRAVLGLASGRGGHGREPTGGAAHGRGDGEDCRVLRRPHRRAAEDRAPDLCRRASRRHRGRSRRRIQNPTARGVQVWCSRASG